MTKNTKIGIIGYGNMGAAIARGISSKYQVFVFDKEASKTKNIVKVKTVKSIFSLLDNVDALILAVKPQDFNDVLAEIKNNIDDKLIISIAAGRPTRGIEKILGKVRVVRVMPNLPAKIGKGMSCLCKGKFANNSDLKFAKKIFDFIGDTLVLNENMMDAATADSGSGPGFICQLVSGKSLKEAKKIAQIELVPLMLDAGMDIGFKRGQAELLAVATTAGTMALLEKSNISAENLLKQVASKGGTTEAGLKVLKGNKKFLSKAFKAALKRAKELSRR
ncbi:MAG: pyrroline-5-carboxylate reductase [Candidatus Omnitrophica bacterium]|jgi:pyrroline-5-carboxylate reductase|nr:pyrroline-5-carboxylate reductase [Candidatus Omnitrophota bacterium]